MPQISTFTSFQQYNSNTIVKQNVQCCCFSSFVAGLTIWRLYWPFTFWHIAHLHFFIFVRFCAARIVYTFGCHNYATNLSSVAQCICVHQGNISAAAGFEPGTPGLWVNHATNELSWRHAILTQFLVSNDNFFSIYHIKTHPKFE